MIKAHIWFGGKVFTVYGEGININSETISISKPFHIKFYHDYEGMALSVTAQYSIDSLEQYMKRGYHFKFADVEHKFERVSKEEIAEVLGRKL